MFRWSLFLFVVIVGIVAFLLVRRSQKKDKIRRKILISFNMLVFFLLSIAFAIITIFIKESLFVEAEMKILAITQNKAHHIDAVLHHTAEDVETISTGNAFQNFFNTDISYENRYSQLKRRVETLSSVHEDYTAIEVVSKDGYTRVSSQRKEGDYVGNEEQVIESLQGMYFGDPYLDQSSIGKMVFTIGCPILVENKIEGALLISYDINSLQEILDNVEGLGEKGEVYLFNEQNFAFSHLNNVEEDDMVFLGDNFAIEQKERANTNGQKLIVTEDYVGIRSASTIYKLETVDWYVVGQMNNNEMLATTLSMGYVLAGIVVLILSTGWYITKKLANNLADPVEQLTENVAIVTKGNWKKKVQIDAVDEVGILSKSIDKMTFAILQSQKDIANQVEKQTEELTLQQEKLRKQQLALLNILEDVGLEKEIIDKEKGKLSIILEGIGDGVFVIDKDYRITRFNKVAEEITGFSAKEAIGRRCKEILVFKKEKDDSLYYDFIHKAMREGKVQNMANHTYLVRKDKSHVQVADSAAPIFNKEKEIVGCVVVFRDVTKEREIDDIKDEFVSVASHQLRTPLTGIKWFIEILKKEEKGKLNKDQKNYLKNIYDSNERMIKLVDDLLSVSRIDTGKKFNITKKKVNIVNAFQDIIKMQAIVAQERKIKILCQKSCPAKMMVNVDESKISEVFANVLSNAIKYSKDGGKVNISVKKESDSYIFIVKDNGLGIPQSQQKDIFEKFFRAENVKKHQVGGNGLGLYIAKSIMLAHDGDIWFKSKEGKGTSFFIKINKT